MLAPPMYWLSAIAVVGVRTTGLFLEMLVFAEVLCCVFERELCLGSAVPYMEGMALPAHMSRRAQWRDTRRRLHDKCPILELFRPAHIRWPPFLVN